jgi:hypothetical protein
MKSLLLTILAITAQAINAQAVANSSRTATQARQLHEYALGQTAGRCLIAKCSVFTGYLVTEFPQRGEAVAVQVEEKLFAAGASIPDTLRLAYADPLQPARGAAHDIAKAWDGVALRRNSLVTVVVAHNGGESASAVMPVLVTSTQQDAEVIRSITSEALLLQRSPEAIGGAVASLSQGGNPALAAFLVSHLENIDIIDNPDTSAMLLSQLTGNENVPAEAWEGIVDHIVLDYDRLTRGSRAAVIRRFVELGQNTDARFASPGLHGLGKIVNFDSSAWELAPPDARSMLGQVYRNFVRSGAISRNPSLEAALGIAF